MFSEAEKLAIKLECQQDLFYFARYMFNRMRGYRWLMSPHQKIICDALMRVYRGEVKRLIINIPPRYSKTELAVINFIAWSIGKNPDSEFIHASYSAKLAGNNCFRVRNMVQSEYYREIFSGVELDQSSKAKDAWGTSAGGVVYSTGTGGTITGFGAGKHREEFGGCIILDDVAKADEATSEVMRANVIDWFQNTLESRTNSPNTPIIVIAQRLHEDDLPGWLLAGKNGEEWEHLCLPAITDDNEALWPAKHTLSDLRRMEKASPYVFSGQYMQRPSPLEGGIIKPDNIGIVNAIPYGIEETVRGWDFASTLNGDYTAGGKIGKLADGRVIILDMVRARLGPDERDAALENTTRRDGEECVVSIPQDPGQAGVTQVKYLVKRLAGFSVHTSPETGNKIVRAGPLASQINVGNVLMLKAEWNDALINEMRMFPNGSFDDQIDALSRAYSKLIGGNVAEIFIPGTDKEKSAYEEVMHGLPAHVASALDAVVGNVCGRCSSFDPEVGFCNYRDFKVKELDPGCQFYLD